MSFFAHLLKTPNRHADDFGVFNATQRCLSCLASLATIAIILRKDACLIYHVQISSRRHLCNGHKHACLV